MEEYESPSESEDEALPGNQDHFFLQQRGYTKRAERQLARNWNRKNQEDYERRMENFEYDQRVKQRNDLQKEILDPGSSSLEEPEVHSASDPWAFLKPAVEEDQESQANENSMGGPFDSLGFTGLLTNFKDNPPQTTEKLTKAASEETSQHLSQDLSLLAPLEEPERAPKRTQETTPKASKRFHGNPLTPVNDNSER